MNVFRFLTSVVRKACGVKPSFVGRTHVVNVEDPFAPGAVFEFFKWHPGAKHHDWEEHLAFVKQFDVGPPKATSLSVEQLERRGVVGLYRKEKP